MEHRWPAVQGAQRPKDLGPVALELAAVEVGPIVCRDV